MRKIISILLTVLVLFSLFQGALRENTVKADNQPVWPMFHYNAQHTGRCPYDTSKNNGTLKWRYQTGWDVDSSPAIASDGTIYVGSDDGYLYAINPDGTLKWRYETGNSIVSYSIVSSPTIASDGTIYVGSLDHYLYAINPDGTLKWRYKTGDCIDSSPTIASDGTIYVGSFDHYLYAINPDGTFKWRYQTGWDVDSSPTIASDGTIYVGSYDNYLYAINPDGTLKWQYETGNGIFSSPAIASDGTIYVGSKDHYLYAINSDGKLKWQYETGNGIYSSPAIASDRTIYVGSDDGYLYAINPDGTLKWRYQTGAVIDPSPAIASDRTIYVGSDDGYLYAINPDGTLKWRYKTGNGIFSSPAIASDGTIYVGSKDHYLYAIGGSFSPDFSISATPSSQTVTQGNSTTYTVNLTSINGFNYSVSLSVTSSLPSGVTYSFSPTPVTPTGSSTLTITTSSSTPANTYTIRIQGTGGGKTHTYDVTLVVQSNASALHHFEFSPISSSKTAGTPFTITIKAIDQYGNTYTGFNSSVTLSVNKGSIAPTTTSNFVNGVLSNFSVTIPTANTGVTITATASGKTGTSNAFDVNPIITASAGSGGYISPSGTVTVNYGESKTFTITPYSGYKISKVKVDGVSVGAVSTYTFQNVTANHTIEASFEKEINQIVIVLQVGNSAFAVNGETRYLDSPPIIKNGRTFVPIRAIIEALGGTVQWNPDEKRVDIILGNNHLILQVGNPNAYVNGVQKFIDASNIKVYPEIINGRTMLPLRFVAENLGCDVQWDSNTQTITITYGGGY